MHQELSQIQGIVLPMECALAVNRAGETLLEEYGCVVLLFIGCCSFAFSILRSRLSSQEYSLSPVQDHAEARASVKWKPERTVKSWDSLSFIRRRARAR